jgi:Transposase DDE domain group 1
MSEEQAIEEIHPKGDGKSEGIRGPETGDSVDTFAGKVQVKWMPEAAVSSLGLMPYFIEFLKTSGVFDAWVEDCPLEYKSPNAPRKRDVLGTILLSVLSGHWRYAHISAIRGDGVNPDLLGMKKVASEDSVRRALMAIEETAGDRWMRRHLKASYEPLLEEPWILDVDSTVKLLYGHQEDATLGYNPIKPGRPSHVYHTDFIANLRIVLEVEVQAGNQTATSYAQPGLWALLDDLNEKSRPVFLRGDCNWGTERAMEGAEQRNIAYVFKLKQSAKVKKLIVRLFQENRWVDAGQGWQGLDEQLQLTGWTRKRRVVILRRPLRQSRAIQADSSHSKMQQLELDLPELSHSGVLYEYAVLVTSLSAEERTIAQHYRDRGDSENNFDELKNQWAWAGFTTQDRKRCQLMARITALIYNWWTIFMRLGIPDKHAEAVTSRPLALHGIARRTHHSNQTTVEITSMHSKAGLIAKALARVRTFLKRIKTSAEQLTRTERWRLILSAAFQNFLRGKVLGWTGRLAESTG